MVISVACLSKEKFKENFLLVSVNFVCCRVLVSICATYHDQYSKKHDAHMAVGYPGCILETCAGWCTR